MKKILSFVVLLVVSIGSNYSQQLAENFDSGVYPPANWIADTGAVNVMGLDESVFVSPTSSFKFSYAIGHDASFLISSQILNLAPNSILSFQERTNFSSFYEYHGVWISTTTNDRSAFTELVQVPVGNEDEWKEFEVLLNSYSGQDIYLAFVYEGDDADDWFLDNVKVDLAPTCLKPTNLADSVNGTTVFLSWDDMPSVSTWEIEYDTLGFVPGTGMSMITSSNPTEINNLMIQTEYEFYVRAICTAGDSSEFEGPWSFTSGCSGNTSVQTIPYFEDFNSVPTPFLPCEWTQLNLNNDDLEWSTLATNNGNVARVLYSSDLQTDDWLISPEITLEAGTTYELSFDWGSTISGYSEKLKVAFGTGSSISDLVNVILDTTYTGFTDLASYSFYYTPTVTDNFSFGFYANSDLDQGSVAIDNFRLDLAPSCIKPSNLSASVNGTSATLSWTEQATATIWEIEYGTLGFTLGTGNTIITSDNPTDLNNLLTQTEYDFYVRSICAPGDTSEFEGPVSFITECPLPAIIQSVPYTENFQTSNSPLLPCYWTSNNQNGDEVEWVTFNDAGDKFAYLRWNSYENSDDWLISPEVTLNANTSYQIKFDWSSPSTGYNEKLKVALGIGNNPSNLTEVILDTAFVGNGEYTQGLYFFTPQTTGNYNIGFYGNSDADQGGLAIDNLSIEEAPSCIQPTNLMSTVNNTDITVSWNDISGSSNWIVEYGTEGFTPGQGTSIAVTSNSYVISNLDEQTSYDYYVTSVCSSSDTSNISVVGNAITECNASTGIVAPYSEDFEASLAPLLPCYWIQENQNNDDKVWQTYDYQGNNVAGIEYNGSEAANDWLLSPPITLTGGQTYNISFDWGSTGTSYTEALIVSYGQGATGNSLNNLLLDTVFSGLPGLTSSSFEITVATTGEYTFGFLAYSPADQLNIIMDNFSVDISTGLNDLSNSVIKVFPNPANDILNIKSEGNKIVNVEITDVLGKVQVSTNQIVGNQINISNLATGTYFVNIESERGELFQTTVVKK